MNLPVKVTRTAGRAGLLLKKHAPDILFGLGITGVIGAGVMLAQAARKHDATKAGVQNLLSDHVGAANDLLEENEITDVQYKQYIGRAYIYAAGDWVKLYGPAIGLYAVSIVGLIIGHRQTKQRMASAVAAYTLMERSYSQYRQRVIEKLGEEQDDEFRHGTGEKHSITVTDADGKKKKVNYKVHRDASDYVALFDEYSMQWRNEAQMNMYFLKSQQAYLNNLLIARGHVFLNEVWDCLGIPRTKAGAIVGWVKNEQNGGDSVIDLGIYSTKNAGFINGYENACWIDPNVDGVIYDLL